MGVVSQGRCRFHLIVLSNAIVLSPITQTQCFNWILHLLGFQYSKLHWTVQEVQEFCYNFHIPFGCIPGVNLEYNQEHLDYHAVLILPKY